MPVEPTSAYPLDAIKTSLQTSKFDKDLYVWTQGDYNVAVITPVFQYWVSEDARLQAQKQKARRTRNENGAVQGSFRPLDDLKAWEEYLGEFKPVIIIEVAPRLGRDIRLFDFRENLKRDPDAMYMKFKTDFYRMKLLCGDQEIEPIQPGKVQNVIDIHNRQYVIRDATYDGLYSYPYDVISTKCQTVTLQLFSEKEPDRPTVKVLSPKTVARIESDFAPLRSK